MQPAHCARHVDACGGHAVTRILPSDSLLLPTPTKYLLVSLSQLVFPKLLESVHALYALPLPIPGGEWSMTMQARALTLSVHVNAVPPSSGTPLPNQRRHRFHPFRRAPAASAVTAEKYSVIQRAPAAVTRSVTMRVNVTHQSVTSPLIVTYPGSRLDTYENHALRAQPVRRLGREKRMGRKTFCKVRGALDGERPPPFTSRDAALEARTALRLVYIAKDKPNAVVPG